MSPWTLCFLDKSEERDYASYHGATHLTFTAIGSLAEVLLPIIMALKVLTSGTFTNDDMPVHGLLIGAMVLIRGLPFIQWMLSSKTMRSHYTPILLASRVLNISITLQFLLMLQVLCLSTHCQLVRTMFLDILFVVLLAEPVLKPLRFVLHIPLALSELAVATYTLSSPFGVCGALQSLAYPDMSACDHACMASAANGSPDCATIATTKACPFHEQLGPVLRPMLNFTLYLMNIPSGGHMETCPALRMVGQHRCRMLSDAIRAAANLLVRGVGWLTVGTLSASASVGDFAADRGMCGELALAALVVFVCVACMMYHVEACRRWQWWQARHAARLLHPPLRTLRMLLIVQHAYVVLGVLSVASVTMLKWI